MRMQTCCWVCMETCIILHLRSTILRVYNLWCRWIKLQFSFLLQYFSIFVAWHKSHYQMRRHYHKILKISSSLLPPKICISRVFCGICSATSFLKSLRLPIPFATSCKVCFSSTSNCNLVKPIVECVLIGVIKPLDTNERELLRVTFITCDKLCNFFVIIHCRLLHDYVWIGLCMGITKIGLCWYILLKAQLFSPTILVLELLRTYNSGFPWQGFDFSLFKYYWICGSKMTFVLLLAFTAFYVSNFGI